MSENKIQFLVTGSSDEPYEVVFMKDGEKISAIDCQSARGLNRCMHFTFIIQKEK